MHILDALDFHARFRSSELAILHAGGAVSFAQLRASVLAAASRIRAHGFDSNLPVGVYITDPFHQFVLTLALMHEAIPSFSGSLTYEPPPDGVAFGAYISDRHAPFMAGVSVVTPDAAWFAPGPAVERRAFKSPKSLVRILASSGTTGRSKAVAFDSATIERGIRYPAMIGALGEASSMTLIGLSSGLGFRHRLGHLQMGNLQIFPPQRLVDAMNVMRIYGVKFLTASPQHLQTMLEIAESAGMTFPTLTHLRIAGSVMPRVTLLRVRARLCPNVTGDYGCTEAGMIAEAPGDLLDRIPGCAGIVHPFNKVEIVDDDDRPLAPGAEGNVRVWSPSIVTEYLGTPHEGDRSLRDGWFYPGDLGRLTPEGLLVLLGRVGEVINAGGVKVSPDLIAGTLLGFGGIRDAAAFGIDLPDRPTEICAAIVTHQPIDTAALLDSCRRVLGARAPHRIVRVEQIPRNQMGKVLVRELRQRVG